MRILFALILFVAKPMLFSGNALGQESRAKQAPTIDFEDELIQGEGRKPELTLLMQKRQENFKRLIKMRDDFLPEMRRSAEDLRTDR